MTLREALDVARRWWWLVVAGTILAGFAGYVLSQGLDKVYEGRAVVAVNEAAGGQSRELAVTYVELVEADRNLERAIPQVAGATIVSLRESVTARVIPDTRLIEIVASANTAAKAAATANAVANSLPGYIRDQGFATGVTLAISASPPASPASPNVAVNTVLAAVLGFLLLAGAIALVEYLDDHVASRERVERLGVPYLGSIVHGPTGEEMVGAPALPSLHGNDVLIGFAESYRQVQANLAFTLAATGAKVILVTSAGPGEGKTTTAANLAVALSETGQDVLLVDGDLRKPRVHAYFSIPNNSGLSSTFLVEVDALRAFIAQAGESLWVLPGGPVPPNPTEIIGSRRMRSVIETLSDAYDIVVIDSPPILGVADAALWTPLVDGVLLVARAQKTRTGPLSEAIATLRAGRKPLLGVVLNDVPARTMGTDLYAGGTGGGALGDDTRPVSQQGA